MTHHDDIDNIRKNHKEGSMAGGSTVAEGFRGKLSEDETLIVAEIDEYLSTLEPKPKKSQNRRVK